MLILVFGQCAFEKCFHKCNIPYGGIIVAITWGIGHFFTKDIATGIITMISGLTFKALCMAAGILGKADEGRYDFNSYDKSSYDAFTSLSE